METDKKKVVTIMSFNSVMEAQLYKSLLESAGVATRMQNDVAAQVLSVYGGLMSVNLLVAEEDQQKARDILGAKFDIDEFDRQSSESSEEEAPAGRRSAAAKASVPAVKAKVSAKAAAKTAAKKQTASSASKPAPAKTTAKTVAETKACNGKATAKTAKTAASAGSGKAAKKTK